MTATDLPQAQERVLVHAGPRNAVGRVNHTVRGVVARQEIDQGQTGLGVIGR
jgi:hypothetical protein